MLLELAEVLTFSAEDAIQVEELEDEASRYFFRLSDGQVLFLSGQYLYDYEEEKKFPCTEFDVVRTSDSKVVIGLDCRGTYFPASKLLPPFGPKVFENDSVPQDLEIVVVPWNQVEAVYTT